MKRKNSLLLIALLVLTGCNRTNESASELTTDPATGGSTSESSGPAIEDVDVVAQTKINLSDELFTELMKDKSSTDFSSDYLDFNVDGVERMLTEYDYPTGGQGDVFTNYTDGDTTSFTSYNGLYTVKVRYLAIDTPESTSEIEEWGKTASLYNESKLKSAKHVIVQSATSARTGQKGAADIDTYQRSLAYVWYTDVDNPTKDDFRNLNLEMVYQGLAIFSATRSEMEESFYNAFVLANDIAREYKRHIYTDQFQADENYYYGSPVELSLAALYDKTMYSNQDDHGNAYSSYCDEYTRWTVEGVVTRKNGNAFYLQDTIDGTPYGLYVFTLRSYLPVQIGNRIRVSGVLSYYGGIYELSGISYSFFNHKEGDIEYVTDSQGNNIVEEVEPIKATTAEIKSGKYNCCLVEVQEDLYFGSTWSSYKGELTSYAYGGEEELNTYNATHPYYNTSNDIIVFGKTNSTMDNVSSFQTLTGNDSYLRVKIPDSVRISSETGESVLSYRYLTGTNRPKFSNNNVVTENGKMVYESRTHYYVPKNPQLAYDLENGVKSLDELDEETKTTVIGKQYQAKYMTKPIGVAQNYVSTGGNSTYSLIICADDDVSLHTDSNAPIVEA